MTLPSSSPDTTLRIYLTLAQYPILNNEIRARMRHELFNRGVITPQLFETELQNKAIRSQAVEGLQDPFIEEPSDVWETRLARIRDHLTDFYFAYNLPFTLLEQIIRQVLAERGASVKEALITFNPELAPQRYLFEQGYILENMPAEERAQATARLQEIKVVLIRTLISDQLSYVNIAKDWFTISDLDYIKKRKIGKGKIGGKSAGMMLAYRIIQEVGDDELRNSVYIPESFFIGADIMYEFMARNGLMYWLDQKYKTEEQIRSEYAELIREFINGELPEDTIAHLREILSELEDKPVIVRSSSLLEDNFGTSFAGKYESHFCPNQGTPEENLTALTRAIIQIYASIFNPDALLYRRAKGLQNYDERMAILIQAVQGEHFDHFFLPFAAGVAYSRNLYRWSPQIRRDDGFLRLVWGLGTRAVDRTGNDYTRLVALSHPTLQPETSTKMLKHYSQQYVDVIDLVENIYKTLLVKDVIHKEYPLLNYLAELDQGDYLTPIRSRLGIGNLSEIVLTFNQLFQRSHVAAKMTRMLQTLEKNYNSPVDTEFTLKVSDPSAPILDVKICILQCRPQIHIKESEVKIPHHLKEEDIIFSTARMVPQGHVSGVRYLIFVPPECYYKLPTPNDRDVLRHMISELNARLENETFICVGPGRWGTSNPDLGIHIGYGDIYNTRALVEITGEGVGPVPEASYGTHFFQDLIESQIYPLAIRLDDDETVFNRAFFYESPNILAKFLTNTQKMDACLRVIDIATFRPNHTMELVMDNDKSIAVAFLSPG
jgi:hypothetical protein